MDAAAYQVCNFSGTKLGFHRVLAIVSSFIKILGVFLQRKSTGNLRKRSPKRITAMGAFEEKVKKMCADRELPGVILLARDIGGILSSST